jgi:nucleotide-binding universal stress UspA family protein
MGSILFPKALVPVNGSDLSERVVVQAAQCVNSGMVGEITLLNVWDVAEVDYTKPHAAEKEEIVKSKGRKVLSKYCDELQKKGVQASTVLSGGNASDVILEQVNQGNYDLIIMGSRKLNKLQELIFGSVSDRVTRLSSIPVLIVK